MTLFYLPDLGEGLSDAVIREWYIQAGDEVQIDQPLLSLETAKALVDIPSPYRAKIKEIYGKKGDVIQTGSRLILFDMGDRQQNETTEGQSSSIVGELKENQPWKENSHEAEIEKNLNTPKILPSARQLAKKLNLDITHIQGTGVNHCITVSDVELFHKNNHLPSSLEKNSFNLSSHTRAMMQVMRQSHQTIIPATIFDDADVTFFNSQTDVTIKLIQAIQESIKVEPNLNAWFDEKSLAIQIFSQLHLGIAMDTPQGLFVPVIHDAHEKNSMQLRETINRFKTMAQDAAFPKTLLQGATFILSNFGKFSGKYATPIIVSPMTAILAVGRVYQGISENTNELKAAKYLPLSLSFDHRIITGGMAARFLAAVKKALEKF